MGMASPKSICSASSRDTGALRSPRRSRAGTASAWPSPKRLQTATVGASKSRPSSAKAARFACASRARGLRASPRRRTPPRVRVRMAHFALAFAGFAPSLAYGATTPGAFGDPIAHLGLLVALVLIAAQVGGELAVRLKQPSVLGELMAGMVLGNLPGHSLGALASDPFVAMLSQLGILILLFEVGLEATVRDLLSVGAAAARVAVLGTFGTLAAGYCLAALILPDKNFVTWLFLGASISATSVGVTARVFKDLGRTRTREARTILGAAVLDDVLGLLMLALVGGWIARRASGASGGHLLPLVWMLSKTLGFLVATVVLGTRLTPLLFRLGAYVRAHVLFSARLGCGSNGARAPGRSVRSRPRTRRSPFRTLRRSGREIAVPADRATVAISRAHFLRH